jgi:DNA-binding CsgD family transcriptional regulator
MGKAEGLQLRGGDVPWFGNVGFNALVLWNFATFALDDTSVFGRGSSLGVTTTPWLVFATVQLLAMIALVVRADGVQNHPLDARARIVVWAMACATSLGTCVMLTPWGWLGAVCAGCGSALLWAMWARYFARLETQQAERVIMRSVIGVTVGIAVLLVLPETARFLLAQAIPFASSGCALRATKWVEGMPAEKAPKSGDGSPSRSPFDLKTVCGFSLPPFLVFFILPFFTRCAQSMGASHALVSVLAGFALATLFTYAFLRFTPSVTMAFIFRWQVPLIAAVMVAFAVGLPPSWAYTLLNCSLIVISEFIWICLCGAMRADPRHAVRRFMEGYCLFNAGLLAGSVCAWWVSAWGMLETSMLTTLGYAVLFAIVVGLAVVAYAPLPYPALDGEGEQPAASDPPAISCEQVCLQDGRGVRASEATAAQDSVADSNGADPDEEFYHRFGITKREREIIGYLLRGRSVPYIRDELYISANTVNTHIKHIYAKTAVSSRQELIDLIESMRQ